MPEDHTAESVFGEVADLYDEVRPEYPFQLVHDVLEWSNLPTNARLLEIGCGTGKATRLFAPFGHYILGVDPSHGVLEVAKRTCTEYPNVEFVEAEFEKLDSPERPFDLVYSAQAFHWVEPVAGLAQVARALKPEGVFSLFWHRQRHPNQELRKALDAAYEDFAQDLASPAKGEKNTSSWPDVVNSSGHFTTVETDQYEWRTEYDSETWVKLLQTHSDHRVMAPDRLDQLLTAIGDAIEAHGGVLPVEVTTHLLLTRKAA